MVRKHKSIAKRENGYSFEARSQMRYCKWVLLLATEGVCEWRAYTCSLRIISDETLISGCVVVLAVLLPAIVPPFCSPSRPLTSFASTLWVSCPWCTHKHTHINAEARRERHNQAKWMFLSSCSPPSTKKYFSIRKQRKRRRVSHPSGIDVIR